jgi:hypothetical protein
MDKSGTLVSMSGFLEINELKFAEDFVTFLDEACSAHHAVLRNLYAGLFL